ncbi:MAG: choice-of-anchor U domain-containing protein [Pseudomonadota bacterium]
MFTGTQITRQKTLVAAVSLALGATLAPQTASATQYTFNWTGYFTMLDSTGSALANTSLAKGTNRFQTPISGTLTYDDATHTGSMTIDAFDFFSGTAPAVASGVTLSDTDGAGAGTLLLGNMLFDWNGNNGIPVSIAWDAAGLLSYLAGTPTVGATLSGTGASPASDGTYTDATYSYLALGATPVATTEWNTTLAAGCSVGADSDFTNNVGGGCMGVNPSGALPLVTDTAANSNEFAMGDGVGIGGNPMADGPFQNFNANFDLTSLTLISDGSGPVFTEPADVSQAATAVRGDIVTVNLGTVTDETGGVTIEYSTDGLPISDGSKSWTPDDGVSNPYGVTVTDTVNTLTVDWRADDGVAQSFATQTVTVTINDAAAPTFSSVPADFSVTINSTAETIVFEGPTSGHGTIAASDTVDAAPVVEWSLDGLNWTVDTAGTDESSNAFASGTNIVYWRATDDTGNQTVYEQRVTVNLPTGIVGQPCTVDTDLLNAAIGNRLLEGTFTMRDPAGAVVGTIDPYVTGWINTATVCTDESCTDSGAALSSPTPFYGNLWTTNTIRLFNQPGNYSFNAIQDGNPSLGMTVGTNQLGAHMLFDWAVNRDIDVVLVWNYGCGDAELVTTDPDGDGIIGTRMVDGPFQGFNAAFDLRTVDGESPITTGGYSVTIAAVNNPVANTSPLPVDPGTIGTTLGGVTFTADQLSATGAASDSRVVSSCVGGCFDFSVSGRTPGETIQVVLPLSEPIPYYALYRKYTAATNSWGDYAVSGSDSVMTAPLNEDGRCPEPGAGDYTTYSSGILPGMLRPGDQCVQLTITDNGPNDSDPADGVIADPSGVGVTSAPATPEAATSSGCTLATRPASLAKAGDWLLVGLALAGLALFRRRTA